MAGGEGARWRDQEMADVLLDRAVRFLDDHQADPFFLFFSFHDIHVPRVPHDRFVGRTGMGSRGDAIAQMDWVTGELINALRTRGLDERTLVLFTSDNGPVLDDGYGDDAVEALGTHQPSGPFRGGKYSAYEAGTRVPTIASWPGTITARTSDALVSQVDLLASLARLADVPLGPGDAPDSADLLDAWLGQSDQGRQELIEESFTLALRRGRWKYIRADAADAQTWIADDKGIESGLLDVDQLFDLEQDAQERDNVADRRPEVVNELRTALQRMVDAAGTRPGFEGSD
jgi:arylsulfatase A-like enzyme